MLWTSFWPVKLGWIYISLKLQDCCVNIGSGLMAEFKVKVTVEHVLGYKNPSNMSVVNSLQWQHFSKHNRVLGYMRTSHSLESSHSIPEVQLTADILLFIATIWAIRLEVAQHGGSIQARAAQTSGAVVDPFFSRVAVDRNRALWNINQLLSFGF